MHVGGLSWGPTLEQPILGLAEVDAISILAMNRDQQMMLASASTFCVALHGSLAET